MNQANVRKERKCRCEVVITGTAANLRAHARTCGNRYKPRAANSLQLSAEEALALLVVTAAQRRKKPDANAEEETAAASR